MITVALIYAICWLPLHSITLIGDTHYEIWTYRYILHDDAFTALPVLASTACAGP